MRLFIAKKGCGKCRQQMLVALHHQVDNYIAAKGLICLQCGNQEHFSGRQVFAFYTGKHCVEKEIRLPGKFNSKAVKVIMGGSHWNDDEDDKDDKIAPPPVVHPVKPPNGQRAAPPVQRRPEQRPAPISPPIPPPKPVHIPTAQELFQQAKNMWDRKLHTEQMAALFLHAADKGHAEATYYFALYLRDRVGRAADYTDVAAWYEKAVQRGSETAQLNYKDFYFELGLEVKKKGFHELAVNCYEKAARKGHAGAQNNLGVIYDLGEQVARDNQKAVYWYEQAARNGSQIAQSNLAFCYKEGRGVAQNMLNAVYWFEKAAEQGNADAKAQLPGLAYMVAKHYISSKERSEKDKAFAYLNKALKYGNSDSLLHIGYCYEYGYGVEQSYEKAIEYYRRAEREGNERTKAYEWLADCYYNYAAEYYDDQFYDEAFELYEKAAEMDHAEAMLSLAKCYYKGDGVRVNDHLAAEWMARGSNSDDMMYVEVAEELFENDERERALEWCERAAELGNGRAMSLIGEHYYQEQNYDEAIEWFLKARDHDCFDYEYELAQSYMKLAERALDYGQIGEAIEKYKEAELRGAGGSEWESGLCHCYCQLAREAVDKGDYEQAAAHYEAVETYQAPAKEEEDYLITIGKYYATAGNLEQAIYWYKKASLHRNEEAAEQLGITIYSLGKTFGNKKSGSYNPEKAFQYYKEAAQYGNEKALIDMALCYAKGEGVRPNLDRAREIMVAAENPSSPQVQNSLGWLYSQVNGDYEKAFYWYEKAANNGSSTAQRNLAIMYRKGFEWNKDLSKAVHWLEKAIAQGNKKAQKDAVLYYFELALEYEDAKQVSEAAVYYRKAATLGHDDARFRLGILYQYELEQYDQAAHWYEQAAEQGNNDAGKQLGDLYQDGKLGQEDGTLRYLQALHWYEQAAKHGNKQATEQVIRCNYHIGRAYAAEGDHTTAFTYYHKAASQGFIHAQLCLGQYYLEGFGAKLDFTQAAYWFKQAAEQGSWSAQNQLDRLFHGEELSEGYKQLAHWHDLATRMGDREAQRNMGSLFFKGEYISPNYEAAIYWYEKAIEQEDALAAKEVIPCYYALAEECDKDNDFARALHYFTKAAERGHAEAQCMLGVYYAQAIGTEQDDSTAAYWYEQAAKQGNSDAQYRLAHLYAKGQGVPQNDQTAAYWYDLAAKQDHTFALYDLAMLYINGRGVIADLEQAEQLLTAAYMQGYEDTLYNKWDNPLHSLTELYRLKYGQDWEKRALEFYVQWVQRSDLGLWCYDLALCFETGYCRKTKIHTVQDLDKAFHYYHRAAEQGSSDDALYKLGTFYLNGFATGKDEVKAIQYFMEAAEWNDHADALNALGECHFTGQGVPQDYDKTFEYCRKAAELDHAEAQYNVGFCYEHGYGVEQNVDTAIEWYKKSAAQGFELAQQQLLSLKM